MNGITQYIEVSARARCPRTRKYLRSVSLPLLEEQLLEISNLFAMIYLETVMFVPASCETNQFIYTFRIVLLKSVVRNWNIAQITHGG